MDHIKTVSSWVKHKFEKPWSAPLPAALSKNIEKVNSLTAAREPVSPVLPGSFFQKGQTIRKNKKSRQKGNRTVTAQDSPRLIIGGPLPMQYPIRFCPDEDARRYMLRGRQLLLADRINPSHRDLPEQAFEVLSRAFEIEPENIAINFWVGQAARLCDYKMLHAKEPLRMAVTCFAKVVEAYPGDLTAHLFYVLAILEEKIKSGRPSRPVMEWAKQAGEQILRTDESDILANFVVAFCNIFYKRNDEASCLIERLASRLPENPLVLSFLLTIYEDGLDIFLNKRSDRFLTKTSSEIVCRMSELVDQTKRLKSGFYEPYFCQSKLRPGTVEHSLFNGRQQYYIAPFSMLSGPLIYMRPSLSEYFV